VTMGACASRRCHCWNEAKDGKCSSGLGRRQAAIVDTVNRVFKRSELRLENKPVLPMAVESRQSDLQQRHGTQKLKATDGCELRSGVVGKLKVQNKA
jgi:hypothetical protein